MDGDHQVQSLYRLPAAGQRRLTWQYFRSSLVTATISPSQAQVFGSRTRKVLGRVAPALRIFDEPGEGTRGMRRDAIVRIHATLAPGRTAGLSEVAHAKLHSLRDRTDSCRRDSAAPVLCSRGGPSASGADLATQSLLQCRRDRRRNRCAAADKVWGPLHGALFIVKDLISKSSLHKHCTLCKSSV